MTTSGPDGGDAGHGDRDDGPDDGPDDAPGAATEGATGEGDGGRRRRRRRRRRGAEGEARPDAGGPPRPQGDAGGGRERRNWSDRAHARPDAPADGAAEAASAPASDAAGAGTQPTEARREPGERRDDRGGRRDGRGRDGRDRGGRREGRGDDRPREGNVATSGDAGAPQAAPDGQPADAGAPGGAPTGERGRRERRDRREGRGDRREGQNRGDQRGENRGERQNPGGRGDQRGERRDGRDNHGGERRDRRDSREHDAHAAAEQVRLLEPASPRLEQQRRPHAHDDDEAAPETPAEAWGTDDPGPAPDIRLAADLPEEPVDDDDPATHAILDAPPAQLGDDVVSAVGVRFVANGRVSWFDAGDGEYRVGERILVDGERGTRLGTVAIAPTRKSLAGRERPRRVVRRANDHDLRGEREGDDDRGKALRAAKDVAAALRLPLKVFRIELAGPAGRPNKANVYYTCDERLDMRDLIRDLGREIGRAVGGQPRVELRQLGVRDEAKAVGGIGSCGLTLCCTTWLPDFVPVSIKMAKDQGLVLSPTKVSGQCGRLKCCLVYEQAGYAELRKGLPKLGKRVIGARGEGRVVEVDVLRQRVRVSYGPGDTEVVPAAEVRPMFPSGNAAGPAQRPSGPQPVQHDDGDASDGDDVADTDDPNAVALLAATTAPISAEIAVPAPPDDAHDAPDDDALADIPDLPDEDPSRDPDADD